MKSPLIGIPFALNYSGGLIKSTHQMDKPMKTRIINLFLLPALMAGVGLMLASCASAQLTIS